MTDLDVCLDDLALNAAEAAGSLLNDLNTGAKERAASAMAQGAEIEVRVRLARPCQYSVLLHSGGDAVLLGTLSRSVTRDER